MNWRIPKKGEMPDLNKYGESEDVLCKVAKFGDISRGCYHEVMARENGNWCTDFTDDFECNADNNMVVAWCYITKIEGEK